MGAIHCSVSVRTAALGSPEGSDPSSGRYSRTTLAAARIHRRIDRKSSIFRHLRSLTPGRVTPRSRVPSTWLRSLELVGIEQERHEGHSSSEHQSEVLFGNVCLWLMHSLIQPFE